jgi:hypothetical protein
MINTIKYKNEPYSVVKISYKEYVVPFIVDHEYIPILKSMDLNWNYKKNGGYIYTKVKDKEIFLHDVIVNIECELSKQTLPPNYTIEHVNKIGIDNRISNLKFNTGHRNQIKKKRTVDLTKYGIKANDIPTYIWYMKANGGHGQRFAVKIGDDINWKTTSSKDIPLKIKLKEAKQYLLDLKKTNPSLFEENCMNGEFNENGKQKLKECYDILTLAGFKKINKKKMNGLTMEYLNK